MTVPPLITDGPDDPYPVFLPNDNSIPFQNPL